MSWTPQSVTDVLDVCFDSNVNSRGMPCLRPWSRSWPLDKSGRMTFLKIPSSVDVSNGQQQQGLYGGNASLAELPPELQWTILSYLPAVDRVCCAITCKKLASSALSSSYLNAAPRTPWPLYTSDYFPSRYLLIQRLAHGWVDKQKLRYCWHCQKIMPREAAYFWKHLESRKSPRWDFKVDLSKEQWRRLSKKKKYQHLIDMWCDEVRDDNSYMSCRPCRNHIWGADPSLVDLEKHTNHVRPKLFPVECPLCLEKSLTYVYKPPRKKKIRPFLWRTAKSLLSILGHTVLLVVYLVYLLFKLPFDLVAWLWKRYKMKRLTFRKVLCMA